MKKEQADNIIKDKLDAMTTLGGGMVFAKEEAWEKLQSRLEAKPARKMPLGFWLSAAAVLLLLVCIIALFRQPEQQVAHNKPDGKELKQVVIDTAKLQKSPFVVNPKTPAVHPAQPVFYKHKQIKTLEKITDTYIIPETPKLQIAIVENNNIQPKDTVINGKPPLGQVVAKVKMKVVHINELDLTENEPEYPSVLSTAPYTPSISIRHMKIVHINELGIEDPETNAWYRDFHNNPVRITFFNNLIRDTYANYGKLAY